MDHEDTLDIAVIGMSARFPGAKDLDIFWKNLKEGKESITFFSDEELASYHDIHDPDYVKAAPSLEDVDKFDASFFGYAPREAQMMDPQHRLILECATSALEHSGYASNTYDGLISVFAGSAMNTYLLFSGLAPRYVDEYLPTLIGNDKDFLATRISYKLNLKGPSVTVQTACSTALVATHMACQSLLNGESDIALAGAVSVRVPHNAGHMYIPGSVFSPDGHCRPFDAKANGTIFGSGVGVVVLKRLDEALEDGDYIHAVIKGSAINNDGASKVDYTAPSVHSQSEAIAEALGVSGIDPTTISYVEAHGTGTALGDPIEVAALTKAYKNYTNETQYCAIGSVKSNIGHLDVAAGMAGLMKTILALKHKQIPPTLHYSEPNPEINFSTSPFYVNNTLQDWNPPEGIRRAGISALGIGGTNAHVILEEAPLRTPLSSSSAYHLLPWSAKSIEALDKVTSNLKEHLIRNPEKSLGRVAFTLQKGRNVFTHKRFTVAKEVNQTIEILKDESQEHLYTASQTDTSKEIIFMYPGQGTQYVNMGRDLYLHESVFRATIDECARILQEPLGQDIRTILYPNEGEEEPATRSLKQTAIAQPALFSVSYALSKLLISWGIEPDACIGHSIGEYTAACLAGVFSLYDALHIVVNRGRFMQAMPEGAMLAIPLPKESITPYVNDSISLAAVNGTDLCVVSGTTASIKALSEELNRTNIEAKLLHTSHGFHSSMMQPAADSFRDYLNEFTLHPPQKPFISNLTGDWITLDQATSPQYWANHLRNAVLFEKGISNLVQNPSRLFVEVGPGRSLSTLLRTHPNRQDQHLSMPLMRHPKQVEHDQRFILRSLGRLWLNGVTPNWDALHHAPTKQRIPLPSYPFARQSHWFEAGQEDLPLNSFRPSHVLTSNKGPEAKESAQLYHVGWKRVPTILAKESLKPTTWLLFTDSTTYSDEIKQALEAKGHTVYTIKPGNQYKQINNASWTINPKERRHYDQVLAGLKESNSLPTHVLHAWNSSRKDTQDDVLSHTGYSEQLYKGFFSLLYVSQALQEQEIVHPITFLTLSSDAHEVIGTEKLNPLHATLHGPSRIMEKETPNINSLQIDLDSASRPSPSPFIDAVLELIQSPTRPAMLAYRGKHFWVPEFSLHHSEALEQKTPIHQKGVYLITGGLGGLGLAFAEWFAQEYQATLLLLSRSHFPKRDEWDTILNNRDSSDVLARKVEAIRRMESFGARVLVLQADVTNLNEMQSILSKAQKDLGGLNGVIHAAGIIEDTLIALKETDSAFRVLDPKVKGTLVLKHLLDSISVDFFILCSSINAYLSPAGQIDYSAANAFQDAFAYAHRHETGIHTISLNWPGWKETGMLAAKKEAFEDQPWFKREFNRAISTREGIECLKQALRIGAPQLIVSKEPVNLSTHKTDQVGNHSSNLNLNGSDSIPPPFSTQLKVSTDPSLETQLQHIWSHVLGIKEIGIHDDFFELGGHSLLAVTLFKNMEKSLGALHVPISALIQAPTIAKFSSLIDSKSQKQEWSPLIKIQEGDSSVPLYCVHGAGGNILIYRELASRLGSEHTVYGLQSQGLDGKQKLLSTISDMATQYVEEIKRVSPNGPYMIIGYCMGGTIALEMAQQLKDQGHEVSFLGLIETYNWINLKPTTLLSKARYLSQKIEFHTRNLMLLPREERTLFWQDKLNTLKQRSKVWSGRIKRKRASGDRNEAALHHATLANVWKNNDDAALVYQPKYYDGKITHFRAQQEYDMYSDKSMRFDTLVKDVETRILPVYPAGMMVPPFVSLLAEEIAVRLQHMSKSSDVKNSAKQNSAKQNLPIP